MNKKKLIEDLSIKTITSLLNLCFYKIKPKSILIYETNNCHGECIPSYLKKFKDDGYIVDLLITPKLLKMKPLCRLPKKYKPNKIFEATQIFQHYFLNSTNAYNYEKIFVCTSENYFFGEKTLDLFNSERLKDKILLMEHDNRNIEKLGEQEIKKNKRLYMITNFQNDKDINVLVPDYFGDIKVTGKNKKETVFIVIGALEQKRRNINLLYETIEKLIEENFTNFKVVAIGGGSNKIPKDKIYSKYIEGKGKLNFERMYKEIEKADFFLPLLDPNIEENRNYLKYLTTGSKQIITGFKKPCLINEEFAKVYNFDENNSIVYKENELLDAMKIAIELDQNKYRAMQKNL